MKLLILTDWYHPGYKAGGPIRSLVNLVELLHRDYEIYILTSDRDLGELNAYEGIKLNEWVNYKDQAKVKYLDVNTLGPSWIKTELKDIQPDYVYLNSMFSLKFTIYPLLQINSFSTRIKWILAPRGMLQKGALQYKAFKKKVFLTLLKITGRLRNLNFHATDDQEKQDILKHLDVRDERIAVIGNHSLILSKEIATIKKVSNGAKLLYLSRIIGKKNLAFFLEVLRDIPSNIKIEFTIAGFIDDGIYWQKCLEIISTLPENIKVNYIGPVPADQISDLLDKYHYFVLTSFGENFGHSIFEALSSGRPVIISDQTPWRDLQSKKAGWDIPLNAPQQFQEAIISAANMDQTEYDIWSKSARKVAESYINEGDLKERYMAMFKD